MATFSSTKQRIIDTTENDSTEFSNAIIDFIQDAELQILRYLELDWEEKWSTLPLTASNRFLNKPDDFVFDEGLKVVVSGNEQDVLAKDASMISTFWPNPSDTGVPRYYADYDVDTFILGPTPDQAYDVILNYAYRPTPLSTSNENTWISDNAGDVLFYGSMILAWAFMQTKDNEGEKWADLYRKAIAGLRNEEQRLQRQEVYRYGKDT